MRKFIILFIIFIIIFVIKFYITSYFQREIIVEGVRQENIYFGQTVNLNNIVPLSYSNGIVLAFQMANRNGGINGKKLNLFVYNDEYENKKAIKNSKILIDYENVLGLIGSFGTSISYDISDKVIGQRDIPYIAPLTGSSIIKTDSDNIMILRPSYKQEIKAILDHMTYLGLKNISVIYQNDEYGISCFNDLIYLYSVNNYKINITSATYEKNSLYLYDTYKKILNNNDPLMDNYERNNIASSIDAVLLFSTAIQMPYIINFFKKLKPDIYIYNLSNKTVDELKSVNNKNNIYMTSVLNVTQNTFPILYKKILKEIKYSNDINPYLDVPLKMNDTLIEGFIAGVFTLNILKNMKNHINRKNFINQLYQNKENYIEVFDMKLGPFISSKESKGLNKIYLTKFNQKTNTFDVINTY
jgi:hypothetical protein